MFGIFSLFKTSAKIRDETELKKELPPRVMCTLCSAEKNVMILECKHKCCVKCFHKTKICSQCKKEQSNCGRGKPKVSP